MISFGPPADRSALPSGEKIYGGPLAQDGTLRFSQRRPLRMRLGAPWSLDAAIAGTLLTGLSGAIAVP
jgi:hypothetical protein